MSKKDTKSVEQTLDIGSKKPNPILKKIKLRDGEEDVRQLPEKDFKQLEYRLMADFWQYLNAINTTLVHQQIVIMEIAKKLNIDIETKLDEKVKTEANV
jgi:hypothetical protein